MSETTVESLLIDTIQKTVAAAEGATSFLAGEIPEIIQQFLIYSTIREGVFLVLCSIWLGVCSVIVKKTWTRALKVGDNDGEYFIAGIVTAFAGLLSIPFFLESVFDFAKVTLAPKLYLLEYAAGLVR